MEQAGWDSEVPAQAEPAHTAEGELDIILLLCPCLRLMAVEEIGEGVQARIGWVVDMVEIPTREVGMEDEGRGALTV